MLCPCKDCEKKGCGKYHDVCEKYLEFIRQKKIENNNRREEMYFTASIIKNRTPKNKRR